jgi:hypothetical protein
MFETYANIVRTIVIIGMSSILCLFMGLSLAAVIRFCVNTIRNWFNDE